MKNKTIVESTTPPSNTNTLWLDMSDKNKTLKVFNNGKWEEINNLDERFSEYITDLYSYGLRYKNTNSYYTTVGNSDIKEDIIDAKWSIYTYMGNNFLNRNLIIDCSEYKIFSSDDYSFEYPGRNFSTIILYPKKYTLDNSYVVQISKDSEGNYYMELMTGLASANCLDINGTILAKSMYLGEDNSNTIYIDEVVESDLGYGKYKISLDELPSLDEGTYTAHISTYYMYSGLTTCVLEIKPYYMKVFQDDDITEIRYSRIPLKGFTLTNYKRISLYSSPVSKDFFINVLKGDESLYDETVLYPLIVPEEFLPDSCETTPNYKYKDSFSNKGIRHLKLDFQTIFEFQTLSLYSLLPYEIGQLLNTVDVATTPRDNYYYITEGRDTIEDAEVTFYREYTLPYPPLDKTTKEVFKATRGKKDDIYIKTFDLNASHKEQFFIPKEITTNSNNYRGCFYLNWKSVKPGEVSKKNYINFCTHTNNYSLYTQKSYFTNIMLLIC